MEMYNFFGISCFIFTSETKEKVEWTSFSAESPGIQWRILNLSDAIDVSDVYFAHSVIYKFSPS